jgi:1,2-diacylglycerol 3-beta-glucosyltransferase
MPAVDVSFLGWFMGAVALYYFALFALSLLAPTPRTEKTMGRRPFVTVIVPAHNEELVLGRTLQALVDLPYDDLLVLVVNDASSDATGEIARRFEATERVLVIDRPPEVAGRGKGAVLNDGYAFVDRLVTERDPRLGGRDAEDVLICVVDADGLLDPRTVDDVAALFADPKVGGVQVGVTIAEADTSLLLRCQDIEFVGFSNLAQLARDRLASVGLGGNGQFTRLAALRSLGREPWRDCLTEDLDLSLSLTTAGWRVRFCRTAWVEQQGVRTLRAWLRQRTRWAHGHYQCWTHFPRLLASRRAPLLTRLDLCVYLLFVVFVVVVTVNLILSIAGALGWFWLSNDFLGFVPVGPPRNITLELLGIGPVVLLLARYQHASRRRLRWWELPAYGAFFIVYVYLWAVASMWAWARLILGRSGWAKTERALGAAPS